MIGIICGVRAGWTPALPSFSLRHFWSACDAVVDDFQDALSFGPGQRQSWCPRPFRTEAAFLHGQLNVLHEFGMHIEVQQWREPAVNLPRLFPLAASRQFPKILVLGRKRDARTRDPAIDAKNRASINPIYNDPALINVARVQSAVDGWNTIEDVLKPNIISVPQQVNGISKWVGNISSDYRFRDGFLRGLRVGGGVRYRGPMGVGYRGSDTIVDPTDPTKAIDDPTVDGTTPVMSPAQWITTGSLSYTFKLRDSKTLRLDLNIDNLLNDKDVIYTTSFASQGSTYLRPRTTISSPARVTVPGAFSYTTPRNYALSATLGF